jgi:DNA-binding transcriptional ArsR family regulator
MRPAELREIEAMWVANAGASLYEQSDRLVALFAALGEPTRMELVLSVYDQRRTAGELTAALEQPAGTVSHHLRVLMRAGVLTVERRGRERWYGLAALGRDVLEAGRA